MLAMILGNFKGKAKNFGEVFYPAKNNCRNRKKVIDKTYLALYNSCINKENEMPDKKETKVAKKRTSKKVLIAQISEATGKTHKELESLARANIQTIEWVKSLIG